MFDPNDPYFDELPRPQANADDQIGDAQKILCGLLAELPEGALQLVNNVQREISRMEETTRDRAAQIRQRAEEQVQEMESKADERRRTLYQHALEQLEPLQKDLFRSGDLGGALAVFVQIQVLRSRLQNVQADPGNLTQFQQGKSYLFRITGANNGPVWGSDVYTADSHLATAAVHAGAVEFGEEAVVRVTMVDMSGMSVIGSMRNGIATSHWGPYRLGFRVCRA